MLPLLVRNALLTMCRSRASTGRPLDRKQPHRVELLGRALVLWWEPGSARWRLHDDLCPHRLVPLSEGRVSEQGRLQCGYHGWEFSGSGACERIPQGGLASSPRACLAAYPVEVRQGLVWARPIALPRGLDSRDSAAGVDTSDIPIVPELEDPEWVPQDTWRDLPYDYSTLMENVVDSSHVPFTHHKSISNRNVLGDYHMHLTSPPSLAGFTGLWEAGPRAGQMGPQTTTFHAPCYLKHKLDASEKRGFQSLTVVYAVPQAPGRCRLINRNVVRFTRTSLPARLLRLLPRWVSHVGSHVPLEDDQIFLHIGEVEYWKRRAAGAGPLAPYFLASPADTLVAAFRSWLDRQGGGGPWGHPTPALVALLPPRQSRSQLLDRHTQHTAHCASCQQGLALVTQAAHAADMAAACAVAAAVLTAALAAAASVYSPVQTLNVPGGGVSGDVIATVANMTAGAVLTLVNVVAGTGGPNAQAMRSLAWVVMAAGAAFIAHAARRLQARFHHGDYPPPRNMEAT
ncbi:hypothetical protein V8C86DRAFT_2471996 [Haematococcus lacustris]